MTEGITEKLGSEPLHILERLWLRFLDYYLYHLWLHRLLISSSSSSTISASINTLIFYSSYTPAYCSSCSSFCSSICSSSSLSYFCSPCMLSLLLPRLSLILLFLSHLSLSLFFHLKTRGCCIKFSTTMGFALYATARLLLLLSSSSITLSAPLHLLCHRLITIIT